MFSLNACQSLKEGLTGQKKSNSDEFLIEKKNPLVLPPEFNKLPEPEILSEKEKNDEKEIDLETILTKTAKNKKLDTLDDSSSRSLEKDILEKIKNN
jgi:hypothetical protein